MQALAARLIHACAMPEILSDLAWTPDALDAGRRALAAGRPILVDAAMVAAGIRRERLPADNPIVCTLRDPGVAERAAAAATTRSAAAVDLWRDHLAGAVVAIGNAPTALFRLLELLDDGVPPPALVLGVSARLRRRRRGQGGADRAPACACRTSRCAAAAAAAHWRRRRSTRWPGRRRESPRPEPWLNVIGIGDAGLASLSATARAIVETGEFLVGGERHLAMVPEHLGERLRWRCPLEATLDDLEALRGRRVVVLASGDPMWFGVGELLVRRFDLSELRVLPAPSAFSLVCARLGWPLAEVACLSVHSRPLASVRRHLAPGARLVVLSRDGATPDAIAAHARRGRLRPEPPLGVRASGRSRRAQGGGHRRGLVSRLGSRH